MKWNWARYAHWLLLPIRFPRMNPGAPAVCPLTGCRNVGGVTAVGVAPDGKWLASGSEDGTVRIWDAVTGQARAMRKGHTGGVTAVGVAPDGKWLASGSEDGTVRIWDAVTGQARALMRLDTNIKACAWLGTSAVAVGGPAGMYLFDLLTHGTSANAKR